MRVYISYVNWNATSTFCYCSLGRWRENFSLPRHEPFMVHTGAGVKTQPISHLDTKLRQGGGGGAYGPADLLPRKRARCRDWMWGQADTRYGYRSPSFRLRLILICSLLISRFQLPSSWSTNSVSWALVCLFMVYFVRYVYLYVCHLHMLYVYSCRTT